MSNVDVLDWLEHYGVKGQKWGVRRDRGHEGQQAKTKTIRKADEKFERTAISPKNYFSAYNAMADKMNNGEIDRINNLPQFKDRRMTDMNDPVTREYHAEYSRTTTKILNDYAASKIGTNASGTRKVEFDYDVLNDGMPRMMITNVEAEHAGLEGVEIDVEWSEDGHILSIEIPELLEHMDELSIFLNHFGVRGMKWGVRRKDRSPVTPSSDWQRHSTARKKKSKELSDQELRALLDRLNMEQRYRKQFNPSTVKKGLMVVGGILAVGKTMNEVMTFNNSPAGQMVAKKIAGSKSGQKIALKLAEKAAKAATGN